MNLTTRATRAFGNLKLKTQRNSPHILFGAGVVGIVASHVLVARATLKLEPVLDEIKDDMDRAKRKPQLAHSVDISQVEAEHGREMLQVYTTSALKLGKLYGPTFLVATVSLAALTKSHVTLTRRNAALAAGYAALTQAFEDYRERVREEIGEDKELDIYFDVKDVEIDEDGKKKKVKGIDKLPSPYARFFDQFSSQWEKDPERNRYFLQCQQNYWNQRLHAYGHVFLNEVYDSLGLERSGAGAVVGWLLDGNGAGYIDFGLYEETNNARFINNLEWSALLDFNVDGPIHHKI